MVRLLYPLAKNKKGMVCLLHPWEIDDQDKGVVPDCRNHRHLSRRRAFEELGDVLLADRLLAVVRDSEHKTLGFIVELDRRARWCEQIGRIPHPFTINSACWPAVTGHLKRLQELLDAGQPPRKDITLVERGTPPIHSTAKSIIAEALRGYSPSTITARESERNASAALKLRRAQRDQER